MTTRRQLLLGAAGLTGAATIGSSALASPALASTFGHARREVFGRSVRGRELLLYTAGNPAARNRVMVLGCIHGNERAGVPIANTLLGVRPRADTCYLVIPTVNPDGMAANTRQNARGVDLNRNSVGGARGGRPFDTYYPGPSDLSEPESRALYTLVRDLRPTVSIRYHQALDVVDYCGGDRRVHNRYAAVTGMRVTQLARYRGSVSTWEHALDRYADILTVELPSRVPASLAARHVTAVRDLAARL